MAHFYCELARDALIQSQLNESKIKAQQALSINKKCARANIILGDSAAQAKDYEHAIACYTAIEKQSPPYLNMVAENIYNAYEQLHKAEAGLYLLAMEDSGVLNKLSNSFSARSTKPAA